MPKKITRAPWSKNDVRVLKTMARQKAGNIKIAKSLKRTAAAVRIKASQLGLSLSTR